MESKEQYGTPQPNVPRFSATDVQLVLNENGNLREENRRLRQSLEWAIQKLEDYKKITLNPEAVKAVIDHGLEALGGK